MNWIFALITGLLGGGVITGGVIAYFLTHPEKLQTWGSIFLWFFSRFLRKAKYWAIKNEIEGKVNSFVKNLEAKTTAQFPGISIRWATTDGKSLVFEDDKAIIVMRDREHKNKNLVHAAYFFTSESLLKRSKRHLSPLQKLSINLFATKLVLESQTAAAEEQFMCDYFIPAVEKNAEIGSLIKQYVSIEDIGIFFPVLVEELVALGNKMFLDKPNQEVITEVKSLVDFWEKFSQRETGDINTPQNFFGKYTRCAVRIVASKATREKGDTTGHKNLICQALRTGFENVYLIGRPDENNRRFVNEVVADVLSECKEAELVRDYTFKGKIIVHGKSKSVQSYLVHLHNPEAVKYIRTNREVEALDISSVISKEQAMPTAKSLRVR